MGGCQPLFINNYQYVVGSLILDTNLDAIDLLEGNNGSDKYQTHKIFGVVTDKEVHLDHVPTARDSGLLIEATEITLSGEDMSGTHGLTLTSTVGNVEIDGNYDLSELHLQAATDVHCNADIHTTGNASVCAKEEVSITDSNIQSDQHTVVVGGEVHEHNENPSRGIIRGIEGVDIVATNGDSIFDAGIIDGRYINITATGDVDFNTLTTHSGRTPIFHPVVLSHQEGDCVIQAGHDIQAKGLVVTGIGNNIFIAENDINFDSKQETYLASIDHTVHKHLLGDTNYYTYNYATAIQNTSLTSLGGHNLVYTKTGDIHSHGTSFTSQIGTEISAGGDVKLYDINYSNRTDHYRDATFSSSSNSETHTFVVKNTLVTGDEGINHIDARTGSITGNTPNVVGGHKLIFSVPDDQDIKLTSSQTNYTLHESHQGFSIGHSNEISRDWTEYAFEETDPVTYYKQLQEHLDNPTLNPMSTSNSHLTEHLIHEESAKNSHLVSLGYDTSNLHVQAGTQAFFDTEQVEIHANNVSIGGLNATIDSLFLDCQSFTLDPTQVVVDYEHTSVSVGINSYTDLLSGYNGISVDGSHETSHSQQYVASNIEISQSLTVNPGASITLNGSSIHTQSIDAHDLSLTLNSLQGTSHQQSTHVGVSLGGHVELDHSRSHQSSTVTAGLEVDDSLDDSNLTLKQLNSRSGVLHSHGHMDLTIKEANFSTLYDVNHSQQFSLSSSYSANAQHQSLSVGGGYSNTYDSVGHRPTLYGDEGTQISGTLHGSYLTQANGDVNHIHHGTQFKIPEVTVWESSTPPQHAPAAPTHDAPASSPASEASPPSPQTPLEPQTLVDQKPADTTSPTATPTSSDLTDVSLFSQPNWQDNVCVAPTDSPLNNVGGSDKNIYAQAGQQAWDSAYEHYVLSPLEEGSGGKMFARVHGGITSGALRLAACGGSDSPFSCASESWLTDKTLSFGLEKAGLSFVEGPLGWTSVATSVLEPLNDGIQSSRDNVLTYLYDQAEKGNVSYSAVSQLSAGYSLWNGIGYVAHGVNVGVKSTEHYVAQHVKDSWETIKTVGYLAYLYHSSPTP